jgi:hypothetical protein
MCLIWFSVVKNVSDVLNNAAVFVFYRQVISSCCKELWRLILDLFGMF